MHDQVPDKPLWVTKHASTSIRDEGKLLLFHHPIVTHSHFKSNGFSQCYNTIYGYPGLDSGLCMVRVLCASVATFELCTTEKANPKTNRGKRTGHTTASLRSVKTVSYFKSLPSFRLSRWRRKPESFEQPLLRLSLFGISLVPLLLESPSMFLLGVFSVFQPNLFAINEGRFSFLVENLL